MAATEVVSAEEFPRGSHARLRGGISAELTPWRRPSEKPVSGEGV